MAPVNAPVNASVNLAQAAATHLPLAVKDLDENKVTPGLLGFVVFACMAAALWLLLRNMNKQFKKIDFEEQPATPKPTPATATRDSADPATAPNQAPTAD
jgi:hypothetical protein